MESGLTCTLCGGDDGHLQVGWSLCGACFRADSFNGTAYWTPLWCGLLMLVALGFLSAAMVELAG